MEQNTVSLIITRTRLRIDSLQVSQSAKLKICFQELFLSIDYMCLCISLKQHIHHDFCVVFACGYMKWFFSFYFVIFLNRLLKNLASCESKTVVKKLDGERKVSQPS